MDKECKVCGEINDVGEGTIFYTCDKCLNNEPKPSGRLLTEKELIAKLLPLLREYNLPARSVTEHEGTDRARRFFLKDALVILQKSQTARIEAKDAECGEMLIRAKIAGETDAAFKYEACIEALGSSIRRFWAKVEVCPNGCWEWRGATNGRGYGQFWNGERLMPAHRFLYELFIKKIENDLEPDHLCRNQRCVNPSHLEAVTHRENLRRGMGRQHWLNKTHCKHGHPFNEENTYTKPGTTWRDCRACHQRWSRETRLRKRLERIEALKATQKGGE